VNSPLRLADWLLALRQVPSTPLEQPCVASTTQSSRWKHRCSNRATPLRRFFRGRWFDAQGSPEPRAPV